MKLKWPVFASGPSGWTGIDTAPDGRVVGVSVRPPAYASGRPQVTKVAQSSAGVKGQAALDEVSRKLGAQDHPWTLPLARGEYKLFVIAEPPVLAAELDESVRWALASLVDFPIESANVVWMRIPTAEFQPSAPKQIYAVVSQQSLLDTRASAFEASKINLQAIDVRETAQRNIAALLEKKGEGLGLLTFGADGITATFSFQGELYHDRFIDQSLDEIVAADAAAQERFFERVAVQVGRSLDFIGRDYSFMSVGRVVLAGVPPQLAGMREYLSSHLPIKVESLYLGAVMDLTQAGELARPENQGRYLIALGAALRGVRKTV